jgi:hypothetical protein
MDWDLDERWLLVILFALAAVSVIVHLLDA